MVNIYYIFQYSYQWVIIKVRPLCFNTLLFCQPDCECESVVSETVQQRTVKIHQWLGPGLRTKNSLGNLLTPNSYRSQKVRSLASIFDHSHLWSALLLKPNNISQIKTCVWNVDDRSKYWLWRFAFVQRVRKCKIWHLRHSGLYTGPRELEQLTLWNISAIDCRSLLKFGGLVSYGVMSSARSGWNPAAIWRTVLVCRVSSFHR